MKRAVSDIDKRIGRTIRKLRKARGVTQVTMSQRLGISYQQCQKYETGGNRIPVSRLYQIAEILEVSITTFFPKDIQGEAFLRLNDHDLELVETYHSLPNKLQKVFWLLLDTMLRECKHPKRRRRLPRRSSSD